MKSKCYIPDYTKVLTANALQRAVCNIRGHFSEGGML